MKKILAVLVTVSAAVLMSACSSVEVATTFNNQKITEAQNAVCVEHLNADIWGIYLFNLPLFTGSSKQPGRCAVFSDTVRVDNAVSILTRKATEDGANTIVDLSSERTGCWIPIFLVLWYYDVQVSGNAIK
ncbi:MAG: hypothetical protein IJS14_05330 [Lentisphaeria bacterium]|nr:hypothetical protein [Lentisphaeria bacterium]